MMLEVLIVNLSLQLFKQQDVRTLLKLQIPREMKDVKI